MASKSTRYSEIDMVPRKRLRVLVLAYLISPKRGSEYSVAWNYVTQMSAHCDITILYGSAGDHMGDFDDMDEFLSYNTLSNVNFVAVRAGSLAKVLNSANRRGHLVYTFYFAYRLWHWRAYRVARRLIADDAFDLVHYLGPIGYREPGYLWKLPLPYVWGPIGGATNVPATLVPALPVAGKLKLLFRAAVNWCQLRFSIRVWRAFVRTDVLLTATTENQRIFLKVLGRECEYLPENAIVGPICVNYEKFKVFQKIHLVWIGSIEARKALILLVRALSRCHYAERFIVDVVGDGPLKQGLQLEVDACGLHGIFDWHGQVPRARVRELLSQGHLHIVTSVSEGNPTTIWEAMSCGVPTLSLDHCGMHDTILPGCGFKIPVSNLEKIVEDIAVVLDKVAENPADLELMAKKVAEHAAEFHWDNRPEFFLSQYDRAIVSYRQHVD